MSDNVEKCFETDIHTYIILKFSVLTKDTSPIMIQDYKYVMSKTCIKLSMNNNAQ